MSHHPLLAQRLGISPAAEPALPRIPNPDSREALPNPDSREATPIPDSREDIPDSPPPMRGSVPAAPNECFRLERYPDYEFDSAGTPYMVRQPRRGKRVTLGRCTPIIITRFQPTYLLRAADGKREQKSQRQLRAMLEGTGKAIEYFTMDLFPNHRFDRNGTAYSISRSRECAAKHLVDPYGFPLRRYILHDKDKTTRSITDAQIRRILCGKADENSAPIPEHWKLLSGEYFDYAWDPHERELYRISRKRGKVYEPRKLRPSSTNQYAVANAAGVYRQMSLKRILELGNVLEPDAEP